MIRLDAAHAQLRVPIPYFSRGPDIEQLCIMSSCMSRCNASSVRMSADGDALPGNFQGLNMQYLNAH